MLKDQYSRLLQRWATFWNPLRHRHENAMDLEVALKRFARWELADLLGVAPQGEDAARLRKQGKIDLTLEIPLGGLRSIVRIVRTPNKTAVLRMYPVTRHAEAQAHAAAAACLEKHQVRAPRLLYQSSQDPKLKAIFLVEEFVDGVRLSGRELGSMQLQALATTLASLHSAREKFWGPLDSPRSESFGKVTLRRARRLLKSALTEVPTEISAAQSARLEPWLESWRSVLGSTEAFSLVHGKLHRDNGLFLPDGSYCLLDNTTLEWGVPAADLVLVKAFLCEGDEDLFSDFLSHYRAIVGEEQVARILALVPFYMVLFHLGQIKKYNRRLESERRVSRTEVKARRNHHWNQAINIIESNPR